MSRPQDKPAFAEIAADAWGEALPDWVAALALECDATSQSAVARRLNRSAPALSQIIRKKYPGDLSAFEDLFKGAFLSGRVECPALGLLPLNECRDWRDKSRVFVNVNALRVRMFRACSNCPRNRKKEEDHGEAADPAMD